MTLVLTQPLTEMSTRSLLGGRGGQCVGLTTLLPSCADCQKFWEPYSPGALRACTGIALPFFSFLEVGCFMKLKDNWK